MSLIQPMKKNPILNIRHAMSSSQTNDSGLVFFHLIVPSKPLRFTWLFYYACFFKKCPSSSRESCYKARDVPVIEDPVIIHIEHNIGVYIWKHCLVCCMISQC